MTAAQTKIYKRLLELKTPQTPKDLATYFLITTSYTRQLLNQLEKQNHVEYLGPGKGWRIARWRDLR